MYRVRARSALGGITRILPVESWYEYLSGGRLGSVICDRLIPFLDLITKKDLQKSGQISWPHSFR